MTQLLLAKETIINYIGKYEVYLKPLGKFLFALVVFLMVNSSTGYMTKVDNFSIVLILALMCSFLPANFIIVCAAMLIVLHFYALSMECALVTLILFLVLGLVYFRFAPKDGIFVLMIPLCFAFKIPYIIPLCAGLLSSPVAAIAVACGTVVYYMVNYVTENVAGIGALDAENMAGRFRYVVDGFLKNRTMLVVAVAFASTVIVVYVIRRLSIDHSWTIAIIAGAILQMVVLLLGVLLMDAEISGLGVVLGSLVSAALARVVEFVAFQLDYSRTENVQFEDDEYYYYVKAVPKITVSRPEKVVKKINANKKKSKGR